MELPGEKLVIKLWETLAEKGIGSLLTPWQELRVGKSRIEVRRRELLMLAQAEADAADIRAGRLQLQSDGTSLRLPAPTRLRMDEPYEEGRVEPALDLGSVVMLSQSCQAAEAIRTEINVNRAVIFAEGILADDPQAPSDRELDDDWLFTWRDHAGRVSNEDLQRIWGSLLAGETKSPGRYSIRTMDVLRSLSKREAEEISKFARFVMEGRVFRVNQEYLKVQGLTFDFLLQMQELGLVSGVDGAGMSTLFPSQISDTYARVLRSNGKALIIEHADVGKALKLKVYLLTGVGAQLLGLGTFVPEVEYMREVGQSIANQGFTVSLADWRQLSETGGEYLNAQKIDAKLSDGEVAES